VGGKEWWGWKGDLVDQGSEFGRRGKRGKKTGGRAGSGKRRGGRRGGGEVAEEGRGLGGAPWVQRRGGHSIEQNFTWANRKGGF